MILSLGSGNEDKCRILFLWTFLLGQNCINKLPIVIVPHHLGAWATWLSLSTCEHACPVCNTCAYNTNTIYVLPFPWFPPVKDNQHHRKEWPRSMMRTTLFHYLIFLKDPYHYRSIMIRTKEEAQAQRRQKLKLTRSHSHSSGCFATPIMWIGSSWPWEPSGLPSTAWHSRSGTSFSEKRSMPSEPT